jgi:hypothetical protein
VSRYVEGWECFGVLPDDGDPRNCLTSRRMEKVDWPEAEVTAGLNRVKIELSSYGDDGGETAFVHVWGTDRNRVEAAWRRAALLVRKELFKIVYEGEG